ncbi:hypothetical protein SFC88_22460 [Nocardioides sp. HM23]|uniref:hypothetical protein n=1 Tax=Nocardioides bizhenqiangii TaxID=3095076 RepID=UPI002ACA917F|nr:hypothetical protein [Nocardioides sp. HM23]MDZ5623606.1 hypothetical protein [Nocardioides sp. HM23]
MSTSQFSGPRRRTAALLAAGAVAAGALGLPPAPGQAAGWDDSFTLAADNSGFRNVSVVSTGAGDAVALWIDGDTGADRVRARVAVDGTWGPATWVSPQGVDTEYVEVVANDDGDVAATWVAQYDGVNWKPRGARLEDDGTWSPAIDLWHTAATYDSVSSAIDGDGTLHVAFRAAVAGKETVQVRTWEPGLATTGKAIATEFGASVSVDANEAGQAVLAYGTDESIDGVYAAEFTPGGGWNEPEQVSFLTASARDPQVVIDGAGRSTIFFNGKVGDDSSDWRVHATTENQAGTGWTGLGVISAPGKTTSFLSADTDATGRTLVAWQTNVDGFYDAAYAARPSTGGAWGPATSLNVPDHSWIYLYPEVSVSDSGTQLIDYVSGGTRITKYRTHPALSFSTLNHGAGYDEVSYRIEADVDNAGNAALIGYWDPAVGFDEIRARLLDRAGPTTTLTAPLPNTTKGTAIRLAWTAADEVSGVKTTDVSVKSAAWNQAGFGQSTNAVDDSVVDHAKYTGTPGSTYCFIARSVDNVNNLGAGSPERCTTLPVDDASLVGPVWTRVSDVTGHYLTTLSTTKTKGARLVLNGVKAKRLGLVIHRSANGGKAVVKLGTEVLRTVNFKGTGKRRVVKLATFDEIRSGKVVIRVVTEGKRVAVDGLIVAK